MARHNIRVNAYIKVNKFEKYSKNKKIENIYSKDVDLATLYHDDQLDRVSNLWQSNPELMKKRDEERLAKVMSLIENDKLITSTDYLQAAMILQHGTSTQHYETAHDLAKKAFDMGHESKDDEPDLLWLIAATKDRALMSDGKPQMYGTQYKLGEDDKWYLWDVDDSVTDEEREKMHVEPLAEAKAAADKMNQVD